MYIILYTYGHISMCKSIYIYIYMYISSYYKTPLIIIAYYSVFPTCLIKPDASRRVCQNSIHYYLLYISGFGVNHVQTRFVLLYEEQMASDSSLLSIYLGHHTI